MKLSLSEIITLSRSGFKASEIRELMAQDEQAEDQDSAQEPETGSAPEEGRQAQEQEQTNDPEPEGGQNEEPDYKQLYESTKAALAAAQQANVNKPVSDGRTKSDADIINELIRSYL